ncbi:MAG: aminotransferase class I/II-fold pyridoxal phosphate-dependent enzyme [Clostridiales Family XIII bacterium]|jgi:dTDP-4-amino-4,6-dideoxygalactose transaminase|nr:aminotransferase class I/II-fold pyridoxal phosphate-dependent enzyme [Clostridiales Family XIII bacterium]
MQMKIPLSRPYVPGLAADYISDVIDAGHAGSGEYYTRLCMEWLKDAAGVPQAVIVKNGAKAAELAARLCGVGPGDEVILPAACSAVTARAFRQRGAELVFVDIRPDTMNIDETLIEAAVTPRTKALVAHHFAGVSCEMDTILEIAGRRNLRIVEDAAHAMYASYKGRPCGGIGDFGCFFFHDPENLVTGEGGALTARRAIPAAEHLKPLFPGESFCALLWSRFELAKKIADDRRRIWNLYYETLRDLGPEDKGLIDLPVVPDGCVHGGHLFYVKVKDLDERTRLIGYLRFANIESAFHPMPLHDADAGLAGRFCGEDRYATRESERLVRLPIYVGMTDEEIQAVCDSVAEFVILNKTFY